MYQFSVFLLIEYNCFKAPIYFLNKLKSLKVAKWRLKVEGKFYFKTDKQTNEQTFVIVELLCNLKSSDKPTFEQEEFKLSNYGAILTYYTVKSTIIKK